MSGFGIVAPRTNHNRPWIVITAQMLGFCVYVWKKSNPNGADKVMYVGSSAVGVRRFSGHQVLPYDYGPDDYIELFPCSSQDEALRFESRMIRDLKPKHNKHIPEEAPVIRKPFVQQMFKGRPRAYFSERFKT